MILSTTNGVNSTSLLTRMARPPPPPPGRSRRSRAYPGKTGSGDCCRNFVSCMHATLTLFSWRKTASSRLDVLIPLTLICRIRGVGVGGGGRGGRRVDDCVGPGLGSMPEMRRRRRCRRGRLFSQNLQDATLARSDARPRKGSMNVGVNSPRQDAAYPRRSARYAFLLQCACGRHC